MKLLLHALITFAISIAFSNVLAQVSFTKGNVVGKSYASSTMVASPVLGKSDAGYFILSSGLLSSKRIVQLNLNEEMSQAGEEVIVKLPKGKTVCAIFKIDHLMIVVLWSGKKAAPFECYSYDHVKSELGDLLLTIPVDDYPGREDLTISVMNDDFNDFIAFKIQPKVEYSRVYRKVVMASRKMDKIAWSHVVTDPYVENATRLMGEFKLSDMYFNNERTLITRFSRPFLEEEKEEVQTKMYYYEKGILDDEWHDQVIRSTTSKEMMSLPLPYLDEVGGVMVYKLLCNQEKNNLDLIRYNIRGDEVQRFPFSAKLDELSSLKRLGFYHKILPVNGGFEEGNFRLLIADALSQVDLAYGNSRSKSKHFMVSYHIGEDGLSREKIIDVGWPDAVSDEVEGRIFLANSLDVIIKDQFISLKQEDMFDNFVPVRKKAQSGITYHYFIDDEVYSLHAEYGTGNMSSQLVKWNFE